MNYIEESILNKVNKHTVTAFTMADMCPVNDCGGDILGYVCLHNKDLNLDVIEFIALLENSNVSVVDNVTNTTPLINIFKVNQRHNLNLDNSHFQKIISYGVNIDFMDTDDFSALSLAFTNNFTENLNLSETMWEQLINNTNLERLYRANHFGTNTSPLFQYIYNKNYEKINLSEPLIEYLFKNSDIDICEYHLRTLVKEQKHQYYSEINNEYLILKEKFMLNKNLNAIRPDNLQNKKMHKI